MRRAEKKHNANPETFRLTLKGVKEGVYIDNGVWFSDRKGNQSQRRADPPVVMRRGVRYTEHEARTNGWIV